MRKSLLVLLLLSLTTTAFAQSRDDENEDWRHRRASTSSPRRNAFELTPFVGYRTGGTIFADQTFIFGEDVDVAPSANLGVNFALPLGDTGLKLELMANRQSSNLEFEGGLFEPDENLGDIDVTYLHAGLQIPFAVSRNATPYFIVSGGLANLDPQISGVSSENRFSASAGLGVKIPMSDILSIRLEGRGYYTALEEEDDCTICDYFYNEDFYQAEVNLGLGISF
ncbi:MAG TPA: outer membrane beta-barrel protein [Thermoanaerobaculia bacterium]|jgi:opacity protein-like surface antigen